MPPPPVAATVDEPRAFGHVIGDVLTQRVLLQSDGRDLGDVAMPSAGRVGIWFERRNPRIETDEDDRRWMAFDYQVTTGPQMLTTINLPALSLAAPSGVVLQVPEWPISVAPLTPKTAFGAGALQPLLSDRQAPPIATAPLKAQLGWSLGVLALSLIAWFGWWQWRKPARSGAPAVRPGMAPDAGARRTRRGSRRARLDLPASRAQRDRGSRDAGRVVVDAAVARAASAAAATAARDLLPAVGRALFRVQAGRRTRVSRCSN